MFTGIVEEQGTLAARNGERVTFAATTVLDDAFIGASIAVNGCCLTVVEIADGAWSADVSDETFARTTLGGLKIGDAVNLERPVRLQDRLGGHLVQGHVDAVGEVVSPVPDLSVRVPDGLIRYLIEKGSVTVDGVSLTVVSVDGDVFSAAVIPHTSEVTNLGAKSLGDGVNLEVDVMAKYAERLLSWTFSQGDDQQ